MRMSNTEKLRRGAAIGNPPLLVASNTTADLEKAANLKTLEKCVVGRELLESFQKHLHRSHRIGSGECAPQRVNLRQHRRRQKLFLFSRTGLGDVHRRENAAFKEPAVENDLGVSRAFELLEDHFIHSRA